MKKSKIPLYKYIYLYIPFCGLLLSLFVASCNRSTATNLAANGNEYSIGFYNVENLFDTLDDPTTDDKEFLPSGKNQWTQQRYDKKLTDLSSVISAMGSPTLLGLCEIENRRVLDDLARHQNLKSVKYAIAHFESPDVRGIDVALFYNKKIFKPLVVKPINIRFPKELDETYLTRDILYVSGNLLGQEVHVFVNHWPSRRGGQEASEARRVFVAQQLRQAVDAVFQQKANANIIIIGDFNDEPDNKSIEETLNASSPDKPTSDNAQQLVNLMLPIKQQGLGSFKYQGNWNVLDQIIISKGLLQGSSGLKTTEAQVFKNASMTFNHPKYGDLPNATYGGERYYGGISDHYPVKAIIYKK